MSPYTLFRAWTLMLLEWHCSFQISCSVSAIFMFYISHLSMPARILMPAGDKHIKHDMQQFKGTLHEKIL